MHNSAFENLNRHPVHGTPMRKFYQLILPAIAKVVTFLAWQQPVLAENDLEMAFGRGRQDRVQDKEFACDCNPCSDQHAAECILQSMRGATPSNMQEKLILKLAQVVGNAAVDYTVVQTDAGMQTGYSEKHFQTGSMFDRKSEGERQHEACYR